MQPEDGIRLKHIIEEADEACSYLEGMSFEEFAKDGRTVRAVIRSIEVIGEAASRVSTEIREEYPDIPWQEIIGMRKPQPFSCSYIYTFTSCLICLAKKKD